MNPVVVALDVVVYVVMAAVLVVLCLERMKSVKVLAVVAVSVGVKEVDAAGTWNLAPGTNSGIRDSSGIDSGCLGVEASALLTAVDDS